MASAFGGSLAATTGVDCIAFGGGAAGADVAGMVAGILTGAIRNSAGVRSDALSIVIDLPCVRVGAASCCGF
jgi:hypothetical protein